MSESEEKVDLRSEEDYYDAIDGFEFGIKQAGDWFRSTRDQRPWAEVKKECFAKARVCGPMFTRGLEKSLQLSFRQLMSVVQELDIERSKAAKAKRAAEEREPE